MFSEIDLSKLKDCASRWAKQNSLILGISLFQGIDFPYVLVIQATRQRFLEVKNPATGKSDHRPDPDYVRLQNDWADPECFEIQDDLLEVSQNDFSCSAKISTFFGKWQSHLLLDGENLPVNLVHAKSETRLFDGQDKTSAKPGNTNKAGPVP